MSLALRNAKVDATGQALLVTLYGAATVFMLVIPNGNFAGPLALAWPMLMFPMFFIQGLVRVDQTHGWQAMRGAFPTGREGVVRGRFLFVLAVTAAAILLSGTVSVTVEIVLRRGAWLNVTEPRPDIIAFAAAALGAFTVMQVTTCIGALFRFGTGQMRVLIPGMITMMLGLSFVMFMFIGAGERVADPFFARTDGSLIGTNLALTLAVLWIAALAVALISYRVSVRAFETRDL